METVPNQRIIDINKEKADKDNLYAKININALETAMQTLSANAFKLWCYFAKNQNGYQVQLSKVQLLKICGFSDRTYRNMFDELQEKYYLIKRQNSKTHYDFYELPQETAENIMITVHKQ